MAKQALDDMVAQLVEKAREAKREVKNAREVQREQQREARGEFEGEEETVERRSVQELRQGFLPAGAPKERRVRGHPDST